MSMKTLFIGLLLLSSSLAMATPNCARLSQIVQHHELALLNSKVQLTGEDGRPTQDRSCEAGDAGANIILNRSLHRSASDRQKTFIRQYACKESALIEERIANLENEEAQLRGFEKLHADLANNREQMRRASTPAAAQQRAGMNFIDGLNTATALEVLIGGDDHGQMFKAISHGIRPENRQNVADFTRELRRICTQGRDTQAAAPSAPACRPNAFRITPEVLSALNELMRTTTDEDADITRWKRALAIRSTNNNTPMTFAGISKILRRKMENINRGQLNLTREELAALKQLPDFERVGLPFENLKKDLAMYEIMHDYKFHVLDLKARQEMEIQAKVAFMWSELKRKAPGIEGLLGERLAACNSIRSDFATSLRCLEGLKTAMNNERYREGNSGVDFARELALGITKSVEYLGRVDAMSSRCLDTPITPQMREASSLPPSCSAALDTSNARMIEISSELYALRAVKEEIGSQNEDKIKQRNFALQRLNELGSNCFNKVNSNVSCNIEGVLIPREMEALSNSLTNLIILKKGETPLAERDEICGTPEAPTDNFYGKEELCAVTENQAATQRGPNPDDWMAPTTAPSGGNSPSWNAAVNGMGILAGQIMGSLLTPPQNQSFFPPTNPYMFNYSPYSFGANMGIGDQILFNARYYGAYGYYLPTQGLRPYTSLGAGPGFSYTSASSSGSSYFGR
jgi:hypothetical protein